MINYLYKTTVAFLNDLYTNRYVILQLTKQDFKNRYLGSFLGFLWSIIQPLVMIFVLWFVFSKAFKVGPIDGNTPFIAWLTVGLVPWYFFSEALTGGTGVFQEYSYLVKKIHFKIAILPVVKILSAIFTHIIFLAITVVILLFNGVDFSFYWLQVFYYFFLLTIFLLSLSWITASLQVFIKDINQIINVFLQFGFWLTPIMWKFELVPASYRLIFGLNPMFYILKGYRNSFLYKTPFWEISLIDYYFIGITIATLTISIVIFKKLRPHFADTL